MVKYLNGKETKSKLQEKILKEIKNLAKDNMPILGILQVGNFEESNIYIKHKLNIAQSLGIKTEFIKLKENASEKEIKIAIKKLNKITTGFILQLPLQTKKVKNTDKLLNYINPKKDIDGLGKTNQKSNYIKNEKSFIPATALGIILLLKDYNVDFINKEIGIVGQSKIVGKPLSNYLEQLGCKVRRYDINTPKDDINLNDILIVATGARGCLDNISFKKSVILVDVGIHRLKNNSIVGDINIDNINLDEVSLLTPVPGGIGPMTIIGLMINLIKAYDIQNKTNLYKKIIN
ncbi:bifunctional 5,10-methylenetetrahydrofolate dehydrogenase/5,10-methenyltetrahydrofolate cyclohydrolase [Metamycoplasma gateae]|uniref:Bifunctional protein FolD n=1 Tax=Metamycoplasma gateae TaxID=35769 RepID=A0ABZ2AN37_9BACT|nr:bifunctional 5,10-methylenetetrahydrofolate dehydrogenase/5,10-methenyltetrahydrofolate cyclohydrolase [Metamycoplasma gateae]